MQRIRYIFAGMIIGLITFSAGAWASNNTDILAEVSAALGTNSAIRQILHVDDTGGIEATLHTVRDIDGDASALSIATDSVSISSGLALGDGLTVTGDVGITGDLTVTGSGSFSDDLLVSDSLTVSNTAAITGQVTITGSGTVSDDWTITDSLTAGNTRLGDGGTTNYVEIEADGDVIYKGGAGVVYGEMGAMDAAQVITISNNNPTEIDTGLIGGHLHNVTFPDDHYLTISIAGKYACFWNISFKSGSPGGTIEIEGGLMVNGVAQTGASDGVAHRTIANVNDTGNMGAGAILDLSVNQQVSLYFKNESSTADLTMEHASLLITLWGG